MTVVDRKSGKTFGDVWEAIEDDPVEAMNLRMRANIMMAIDRSVRGWGLTQKEAAARLGITQPRLNMLLRGRINEFSLDALIGLIEPAGLEIEFSVKAA